MVRRWTVLLLAVGALAAAGCHSTHHHRHAGEKKGSRTLLTWAACAKDEKKENGKNGNGKDEGKDEGKEKAHEKAGGKESGNGNGAAKVEEKNGAEEEEDVIATDRPDFTEASSTVGKGRIQLEAGYTYIRDRANGTTVSTHSYPEALFRIGMFADWFELRIGQNFGSESALDNQVSAIANGAEDLYLGVKLALTEQKGVLPEMALILQMTVPTGIPEFTANEVHPGVNLLYGWDVIKDCLTFAGSTQANRSNSVFHVGFPNVSAFVTEEGPEVRHSFLELAQSLTVGYRLTRKLGAYTEWFAFFPHSSLDPEIGPEYYFDGGFTYLVTNNFQLDVRAGVGLNRHADDFFAGSGFAVRY